MNKKYSMLLVSYYFDASNIKELKEQLENYLENPAPEGKEDLEDFIKISKLPNNLLEELLIDRDEIIQRNQKPGSFL